MEVFDTSFLSCLGESALFSSVSFAVASIEMSSKFSVKNFSKDQRTLQCAADALSDYITIGIIWTVINILILYPKYGICGLFCAIGMNFVILAWIYYSYIRAFKVAADENKLEMPKVTIFGF